MSFCLGACAPANLPPAAKAMPVMSLLAGTAALACLYCDRLALSLGNNLTWLDLGALGFAVHSCVYG